MNTRIIFPLIFAAVLFFAKTGAAAQEANSSGHQENISERIQLTIFQNKTILPNKVARSQMELDRYRNACRQIDSFNHRKIPGKENRRMGIAYDTRLFLQRHFIFGTA